MKIVLFEIRKNILRKTVVIPAIVLLFINMLVIYAQYRYNNDAFTDELTTYNSSEKEWNYYKKLHVQFDGEITENKQDKIIELYNNLKEKIDKGDYERGYTEDAKTGYVFGDYSLVESKFYLPIKYFVSYADKNEEIVNRAKENVEFYQKNKNSYGLKKNCYIANQYAGRILSEFYDTTGWKKLFYYNFSDVLLIILMFLCIVPLFHQERISGMENIILGTKKGNKMYLLGKYLSIVIGIITFLIIVTGVNYFMFDMIYGLKGAEIPNYAIEEFQYSPYNLSMIQTYLAIFGCKCLAVIVICTFLCFISNISRNTIMSFVLFSVITIVALYGSGFICSDNSYRVMWAVISPFALFKSVNMFKSLYDINMFGNFFLRINSCIVAQLIIEIILILLSYWKYKHCNMKKKVQV